MNNAYTAEPSEGVSTVASDGPAAQSAGETDVADSRDELAILISTWHAHPFATSKTIADMFLTSEWLREHDRRVEQSFERYLRSAAILDSQE